MLFYSRFCSIPLLHLTNFASSSLLYRSWISEVGKRRIRRGYDEGKRRVILFCLSDFACTQILHWRLTGIFLEILDEMVRIAITAIRGNSCQIFLHQKSGISIDEPLQRGIQFGRHAHSLSKVPFQPFVVDT